MRLRAVYAFNSRQGARAIGTGAPTRFENIPMSCRSAADVQRYMGDSGLCWGHVIEVQGSDAIFITTFGEIERVPMQYLRCIDFFERDQ